MPAPARRARHPAQVTRRPPLSLARRAQSWLMPDEDAERAASRFTSEQNILIIRLVLRRMPRRQRWRSAKRPSKRRRDGACRSRNRRQSRPAAIVAKPSARSPTGKRNWTNSATGDHRGARPRRKRTTRNGPTASSLRSTRWSSDRRSCCTAPNSRSCSACRRQPRTNLPMERQLPRRYVEMFLRGCAEARADGPGALEGEIERDGSGSSNTARSSSRSR